MANYSDYRINQGIRPVFITGAYTAAASENVLVDTASSAITVTLPASPQTGTYVKVSDAADNAGINNITVDRNGNTITALAEDFIIDENSGVVEFVYNGTTWKFALETPGSGLVQTQVDARVVTGTSGTKRDRWYPFHDLNVGSTSISPTESHTEYEASGAMGYIHSYADGSYRQSGKTWVVPENYDSSGTVRYRIIWRPTSTNTGVVRWRLAHYFLTPNDGEDIPGAGPNDYAVSDDAGLGVTDDVQISPWGTKNMTGVEPGDLVLFMIQRAGGDGSDTYTSAAELIAVEFEYQTNAPTED